MNQPAPSSTPSPGTRVQQPLLLDAATFRADPKRIASERQSRSLWGGALGAGLGALLGFTYNRRSPNQSAIVLSTTALGGALGVALGQFGKTTEEAYSDIFTSAAHSNDFVGHVKREMQYRENMAFVSGMLTGSPFYWW